jgi:tetratricopeptide (TPR) repeat protein
VERAQVSGIDLDPMNAEEYLQASQAMASLRRFDRALAFCQQAAALQPNLPDPYADALVYAEKVQDSDAMAWAAGNLLERDWPLDNDFLHLRARTKLGTLGRTLQDRQRRDEAERMDAAVTRARQRDLVIRLSWQGDADLDLKVQEPVGTLCSPLHRQTPGGGTLLEQKVVNEVAREEYVAAEAFAGEYVLTVERVWGRPLGAKATVEVIQHQGTPQQTIERHTIAFDRSHQLKIAVADGRRTTMAVVPPTLPNRRTEDQPNERARAVSKLRALASGSYNEMDVGMRGGMASVGGQAAQQRTPANPQTANAVEEVAYQTKVAGFVSNSMDLTAQARVSADRRYVRLSMAPVFQTMSSNQAVPAVTNPLIPGAN